MAQMPIQSMSGRAEAYAAAAPPALSAPPRAALASANYVFDPGAISGGLLRPGAVDQALFKAHLAAAEKDAALAQPALAKAPSFTGIPSLSPAQLAALGAVEEPRAGELVLDIPGPNPSESGAGAPPHAGQPGGIAGGTGTAPAPSIPSSAEAAPAAAPIELTPTAPAEPISAIDSPAAVPAPAPAAPVPAASAQAERGPIPGSRRGADGVWELPRLPDKDERAMLRGEKWRVVESERSRQLFFGPDGEFGWDDFVDLINPLQHIPLVNIAYRAITGDEIYGAARMVDMAFGPAAGISTVVDLAFRDVTGASMAENAVAALFGPGDSSGGNVAGINTASGKPEQLADAGVIRRGSNR